jgi:uncharacterized protein YbjT (DUF2867 family)
MRIDFRRSGGVAGVTLQSSLDTASLSPDEAAEVERLVRAADLPGLAARRAAPARGADRFQYDIAITERGRRQEVQVGDGAAPESLRPLVDRLLAEAKKRRKH